MFETAILSYGPSGKRVWTTAMGFTGQALLVACALLAPMISPQVLPRVTWITTLAPPGPPPPPPPPPGEHVVPRSHAAISQIRDGKIFIPSTIPPKALILTDAEPPLYSGPGVAGGVIGGQIGGDPSGLIGGIIAQAARFVPVIRPPEPVKNEATTPAPTRAAPRVTAIRMAMPVHRVDPIYPPLAKQARVSGTVELLGVLGTDGRIHELKVLRGHPLLVNAALEAVRQWIYQPTLLNGQAVEVAAPITVNFILN